MSGRRQRRLVSCALAFTFIIIMASKTQKAVSVEELNGMANKTKEHYIKKVKIWKRTGRIVEKASGCHIWKKSFFGCVKGQRKTGHEYGRVHFRLNKKPGEMGAHRFIYFLFKGDLREGEDVSHLCHTPSCVNPAHLIQELHQRNSLRMNCKRTGICDCEHGGEQCLVLNTFVYSYIDPESFIMTGGGGAGGYIYIYIYIYFFFFVCFF